jgi:hypothetical protein
MPVAGWNQLTSHRQDFPARPRARAPSTNKTKPNPPRCALASNYPQVRRSLSEDQMAEPLSRHPARQTATLSPTPRNTEDVVWQRRKRCGLRHTDHGAARAPTTDTNVRLCFRVCGKYNTVAGCVASISGDGRGRGRARARARSPRRL